MKTNHKPTLGQEVFVLSKDGQVTRTRVGKIFADGRYVLLDGTDKEYCSTYKEAVSVAIKLILEKERWLRRRLAVLQKEKLHLVTPEARALVMSRSMKVVDLSDSERRVRTRSLKGIKIPTGYPRPGTMVYVAVTSVIRKERFKYRPHESFILEVPISSVWFTPDGAHHVGLSNPYGIQEYFSTREDALTAHPTISIVIPYKEFHEAEVEFDRKNPPF